MLKNFNETIDMEMVVIPQRYDGCLKNEMVDVREGKLCTGIAPDPNRCCLGKSVLLPGTTCIAKRRISDQH